MGTTSIDFLFYDMPVEIIVGAAVVLSIFLVILTFLIILTAQRFSDFEAPSRGRVLAAAASQFSDGLVVFLLCICLQVAPILASLAGLTVILFSGLITDKLFFGKDWNLTLRLWGLASLMELLLIPICTGAYLTAWGYFCQNIYPMLAV